MCQGVDYTYWGAILWDMSGTYWKASAGKCTGKLPIRAPARLVGTPPAGCLGDLPEAGCSASRNHWNHPLGCPETCMRISPMGFGQKPQKQEERQETKSRSRKRKASLSSSTPPAPFWGRAWYCASRWRSNVYMAHPSMTKQSKGGWVGTERQ